MKKISSILVLTLFIVIGNIFAKADAGYRLWLKYDPISDVNLLNNYKDKIKLIMIKGESETIK